jgi:hypothetical protein
MFSLSKSNVWSEFENVKLENMLISANSCYNSKHILASMIYFDSDMSKSTNTVVYFDWKTVIYIYVCGYIYIVTKKYSILQIITE